MHANQELPKCGVTTLSSRAAPSNIEAKKRFKELTPYVDAESKVCSITPSIDALTPTPLNWFNNDQVSSIAIIMSPFLLRISLVLGARFEYCEYFGISLSHTDY